MIEIRVPDIGDFANIPVIEVRVAPGDTIQVDDTIVVLESDKATLDVPSPHAGRITDVKVATGDTVSEGSLIVTIDIGAATDMAPSQSQTEPSNGRDAKNPLAPPPASPPPAEPAAPAPPPAPASTSPRAPASPGTKPAYASPSIRRFARTLGAPIDEITGTGTKQRITRQDVEAYVKARLTTPAAQPANQAAAPIANLPAWPAIDYAKYGPIERQPLSRIARISGPALARNAIFIPHVTNFDKADVTDLEEFRITLNDEAGADDAKITMLAFAVKAVVAALKTYPKFNASLDGADLIIKNYWNIGVAADTPEGLVVPVVKEADKKSLREIAAEMATLAAAARSGKIKPTDMQGATFTISSLGGIGGTNFTPIINAPEVAILGMTRAELQPVWDGHEFKPRLIQPLSLSWDHRVVDGVLAARFLTHLAHALTDFRRVTV